MGVDDVSPLDSALWYGARGIRIFPGVEKDGRMQPAVKAFYDTASADADQIRSWWERWPDAWVAVATGPTNDLVVIDQDVKGGIAGIDNWQALRPAEYEFRGPQARTGSGGLHDWYRYDGWEKAQIRNSASEVAPGVDVRAWHGFVWAPPSGGRLWLQEPPEASGWVPELPEWAVPLIAPKKPRTASTAPRSSLAELLANPPQKEGEGRNVWMSRICGHYAAQYGPDTEDYVLHVQQANVLLPDPLEEEELQRVIESIAQAEATKREGNDLYPEHWTDAEVGEMFGRTIEGRWLYCRQLGGWMQWDGRRWALDPGERVYEEFRRWVLELSTKLYTEQGLTAEVKQATRYREKGKIDAAVTIARRLENVAANAAHFDQHPYLLNCLNGVVDLRTGVIGPHEPALRITKLAGAAYKPDAEHPDIDSMLLAVSEDVRPWIQRLMGSSMVGKVVDDIVAVLDGAGANGKSTILKAISSAVGDYSNPVSSRLLVSKSAYDEHPTLIADLAGRRLVYVEETPEGGALRMEQLKYLSGGGQLKARFIGKDWFEFEASFQIVVATNHRPAVNASDYAAWRRLVLVPFNRTYRKAHEAGPDDLIADTGLRTRIEEQPQKEATLAWVVAGALQWHADGLGTCAEIEQATADWRQDEDVIAAWWSDNLEVDPGAKVQGGSLYSSYSDWCTRAGRRSMSMKEFFKRLVGHDWYARAHVENRKASNKSWYHGVKLAPVEHRGGF